MGTNRIQIGSWNIELTDDWGYSGQFDPRYQQQLEQKHQAKGPFFRVNFMGGGCYGQLYEVPMEVLVALADLIYRKNGQAPVFVNRPIIELAAEPQPKPQQLATDEDYTGEPNPSEVRRLRNKMEDT